MDISNNNNNAIDNSNYNSNDNSNINNSSTSIKSVHDEHINFDVHSLPASDFYDSDDDTINRLSRISKNDNNNDNISNKDSSGDEILERTDSIIHPNKVNISHTIKNEDILNVNKIDNTKDINNYFNIGTNDNNHTIHTSNIHNNIYNPFERKMTVDAQIQTIKNEPPKKVSFKDVEYAVSDFYSKQQFYSSAFDIISTYIKGQKILYTEACELNTLYLNMLMLPAIFLSALAGVFSFVFEDYHWGAIVVASINAFNGFLLSVVSYSKLDAASEAHKITSHQYDKLQSICEFTSGCLLVLPYDIDKEKGLDSNILAKEKLEYIEGKIKDIKETNNFIIPSDIRNDFRNIYYTNVFSLVKKINETESKIIIDMKNLINKCKQIEYKMNNDRVTKDDYTQYITMNSLINQYHKDFIDVQSAYSEIDKMFKLEVKNANLKKKNRLLKKIFCMSLFSCNKEDIFYDTTETFVLDKLKNIKLRTNKRTFFKEDHHVNLVDSFN